MSEKSSLAHTPNIKPTPNQPNPIHIYPHTILTPHSTLAKNAGAAKASKSAAPAAAEAYSATGSTRTLIVTVPLVLLLFGRFLIILMRMGKRRRSRVRGVWGMRIVRVMRSI
jgi:hypothetical protein